jgi:hypothetical protein
VIIGRLRGKMGYIAEENAKNHFACVHAPVFGVRGRYFPRLRCSRLPSPGDICIGLLGSRIERVNKKRSRHEAPLFS